MKISIRVTTSALCCSALVLAACASDSGTEGDDQFASGGTAAAPGTGGAAVTAGTGAVSGGAPGVGKL